MSSTAKDALLVRPTSPLPPLPHERNDSANANVPATSRNNSTGSRRGSASGLNGLAGSRRGSLHSLSSSPRRRLSERDRTSSLGCPKRALSYRLSIGPGADNDDAAEKMRKEALAPEQKVSWLSVCALMLTDIVGTSVLTLAAVSSKLGWGLAIIMIVGLSPVAIYTAVLMSRARHALVVKGYPGPDSMGDCAGTLFRQKWVPTFVFVCVYGYALLGNASYLLVMGQSLQSAVSALAPTYTFCLPVAAGYACLLLAPLIVGVRNLVDSLYICMANMLLLLVAIFIVIGELAAEGRSNATETFDWPAVLDVAAVFGAATNIVYAYAGHWMYFEIMAEMSEPLDFPKIFIINGPAMVLMYLGVACTGYYFTGQHTPPDFIDSIGFAPNSLFAVSVMLFIHVAFVYFVKSIVLSRFFHGLFAGPAKVEEKTCAAHMQYAAIAVGMLVLGYLFAQLVPFFDEMLGLIGGVLAGPISFLFPIVFFVGSYAMKDASGGVRVSAATTVAQVTYGTAQSGLEEEESGKGKHALGETAAAQPMPAAVVPTVGSISWWDWLACGLVALFTLLTMVVGTYQVVLDIIEKSGQFGDPFSCHAVFANATTANGTDSSF